MSQKTESSVSQTQQKCNVLKNTARRAVQTYCLGKSTHNDKANMQCMEVSTDDANYIHWEG